MTQTIIAIGLVFIAAVWLAWRGYRFYLAASGRRGGGTSCGHCSQAGPAASKKVFEIESRRSAPRS